MAGIKKVVLAYDDSAGSKKALQLAKEITRDKEGVKLYVGHVYEEKVKSELVESTERPIEHLPINNFPADVVQVPPLAMEQGALDKSEHSIITHSSEQLLTTLRPSLMLLIWKLNTTPWMEVPPRVFWNFPRM